MAVNKLLYAKTEDDRPSDTMVYENAQPQVSYFLYDFYEYKLHFHAQISKLTFIL